MDLGAPSFATKVTLCTMMRSCHDGLTEPPGLEVRDEAQAGTAALLDRLNSKF